MLKTIFTIIITGLLIISCKRPDKVQIGNTVYPDLISVTSIPDSKIETGELKKIAINRNIQYKGKLAVLPSSSACVSPPVPGRIKQIYVIPGENIEIGNKIALLTNNDLIDLQKDYLETKYEIEYYEEDYKRQGELTIDNAASIKKMQKAQSEYMAKKVHLKALEYQLSVYGIQPKTRKIENISNQFYLYAPISGIISDFECLIGTLLENEDCLLEITNSKDLFIKISIPQHEIQNIKSGMEVTFTLPSDPYKKFTGKIERTLANKSSESNEIVIYVKILDKSSDIIHGMIVNATINVPNDSVYGIPSDAIVYEESNAFVYAIENMHYKKIVVHPGQTVNGYTHIQNITNIQNTLFVLKGLQHLKNISNR